MKSYQPLLLEALRLRVGPFKIHRLRLNRHIDETSVVTPHRHPHSQLLIYLSGQGEQIAGSARHPVRSGTAALFPPHLPHAFRPLGARRPICLVLDFELRGAGRKAGWVGPLPQSELSEIRRALSGLTQLRGAERAAIELRGASLVLDILHRAARCGGWLPEPGPAQAAVPEVVRRVRRLLDHPAARETTLGELSRSIGYQKDYLNRLLRRNGGMTLGQLRASRRLDLAKRALAEGVAVNVAAERAGWSDANYFARWFRKQTGMSPREWREDEAGRSR